MSNAKIRRAFESLVSTWATGHALPVVYENVGFGATQGSYVQCSLLPNSTQSEDLQGLHRHYLGFFQISLVLPAGDGAGRAEQMVEELDALFPLAAPMLVDGLRIYVTSPMSPAPAISEAKTFFIAVSCAYRADTI